MKKCIWEEKKENPYLQTNSIHKGPQLGSQIAEPISAGTHRASLSFIIIKVEIIPVIESEEDIVAIALDLKNDK